MAIQRRVTQEPVEVAEHTTGASLARRVTQEPVEVAEHTTGASLARRVTQIVIEVGYVQPLQPFGEQAGPYEEPWSPAYIQPPVDSEAGIYSGVLHGHKIILGVPGAWFGRG